MIYIVNGAPGAGKTTFEKFVKEEMGEDYCEILSTIDFIKQIAYECGWDGKKTPRSRKFLSDLKDLLTEWNDLPYNKTTSKVNVLIDEYEYYNIKNYAIFIDCREPKEIAKLKEKLGAKTILVEGNTTEKISNHADKEVNNYKYDIVIKNLRDLSHLRLIAKKFVEVENLHKKKGVD